MKTTNVFTQYAAEKLQQLDEFITSQQKDDEDSNTLKLRDGDLEDKDIQRAAATGNKVRVAQALHKRRLRQKQKTEDEIRNLQNVR